MNIKKIILHLIFIIALTILTQVGGIIWLLSIFISNKIKLKKRILFPTLYLFFNLIVTPPIAKQFGRIPLPVFSQDVKPRNFFILYVLGIM